MFSISSNCIPLGIHRSVAIAIPPLLCILLRMHPNTDAALQTSYITKFQSNNLNIRILHFSYFYGNVSFPILWDSFPPYLF